MKRRKRRSCEAKRRKERIKVEELRGSKMNGKGSVRKRRKKRRKDKRREEKEAKKNSKAKKEMSRTKVRRKRQKEQNRPGRREKSYQQDVSIPRRIAILI